MLPPLACVLLWCVTYSTQALHSIVYVCIWGPCPTPTAASAAGPPERCHWRALSPRSHRGYAWATYDVKSMSRAQAIEGLEADIAKQKKEASDQIESAAAAAKSLAAAEARQDSTAAEKAQLQQSILVLQQQLAPFEGRVQAAMAETKVRRATVPYL